MENSAQLQISIDNVVIRNIRENDNQVLASIVRTTLEEFDAVKPGSVYYDETTDNLYELFQTPGSIYYVAEYNGEVLGGGGIILRMVCFQTLTN